MNRKDSKHIIHFIDTETTGLDHRIHEVISVGIIEVMEVRQDDKLYHTVISEKEFKIIPEHLELADPVALRINKYQSDKWSDAMSREQASRELWKILHIKDKTDPKINTVIVAGHNVHFDVLMLAELFSRSSLSWNPRHALDTYTLSKKVLGHDIVLESYALKSLCEYYNISNEHAHDALSDARATLAVYQKLMSVINIDVN